MPGIGYVIFEIGFEFNEFWPYKLLCYDGIGVTVCGISVIGLLMQ